MACKDPKKRKAYRKAWYEANKESVIAMEKARREGPNRQKILAQKRAYHQANKDKIAAQRKDHYKANRERIIARVSAYREANKDKISARQKVWYEANREIACARVRAWKEANKDKYSASLKAYREANKEKIAAAGEAYRRKNRKLIRLQNSNYKKNNKDKVNANIAKRKAIKRQALLPTTDLNKIKELYKQASELEKQNAEAYHVDHIIPLWIGGAHHQDNMRVITAEENLEKQGKYIPELGGVWADNELARETKRKSGI